jgi:hypothetical protein
MLRYSASALAVCALLVSAAASQAQPAGRKLDQCFRSTDIDNSVQVNQSQLNIRTIDHRYFRVDMKGTCFSAPRVDPYELKVRGSDMICSPVDMDLSAGPRGFKTPCFVDRITQMSPAEVAALPKADKP